MFSLLESRAQDAPETAAFAEWHLPDGATAASFHRTGLGYLVRFPLLADFEISNDTSAITCHPTPSASQATCRNLYMNQVLPLALSKRGKLVFHASAVDLPSHRAVIFAGPSGSGKSTLAAAFATAGCPFLSDDGLVVEEADGRKYRAVPSHPSIRLWTDSEHALLGVGPQPIEAPRSKKRLGVKTAMAFCDEPRQLSRVYVLGDPDAAAPRFEGLGGSQALIELIKNSFLLDPQEPSLLASQFDRLARLVAHVPCFRLHFPRAFDALDSVRHAIVVHAGNPH